MELARLTRLSHTHHILPLCGVYLSDERAPRICIVSPWMTKGDLGKYLKDHPATPRVPLVSFALQR
jgi:hypothetical protein